MKKVWLLVNGEGYIAFATFEAAEARAKKLAEWGDAWRIIELDVQQE